MNRRHFVSLLGTTSLLTGCVSPEIDGSNNSSVGQGTGEEESQTECTVPDSSSLPPATVPSEVTEESAASVALSIEESFAVQRATDEGWNVDGTDGTDTSVDAINGGFLVKATVNIDGHKLIDSETETEEELYGSFKYSGWYRITEKQIERAPGDSAEEPPEQGWTTVACS